MDQIHEILSAKISLCEIYPENIFAISFMYDGYISTEGLLEPVIVQMIEPLSSKYSAQTLEILGGMCPTMSSFCFIAIAQ